MREVLRDEVDLARALQLEQLRLAHDFVERERAVLAAHERDRAERAAVVAAFADLEVAHVRQVARVEAHARMRDERRLGIEHAAREQLGNEAVHLGRAEEEVDLGELARELGLVALDHASNGDDRLARAVGLAAPGVDDRVDRLLLRRVDEAAGVDDDHVGVIELGRELTAVIREQREIALAVDRVLVAAKRDEADLHSGDTERGDMRRKLPTRDDAA